MYSRRKKGKAKNEDESTAHCVYCMQHAKGYFKGVGGLDVVGIGVVGGTGQGFGRRGR